MADTVQQPPVPKGKFVHLHVHTEYSLLDGLSKLPDLMQTARDHGQHALAITDHGAMYGALHFYNACRFAGIKPIIGVELYIAKNSRLDKQTKMGADQFHLTVLAKSYKGYQNINKMVTTANFEGFSYKPRIDEETLFANKEDVIVTSGCMSSLFNKLLRDGKQDEAEALFAKYKKEFGADFYVEIQIHPQIKELDPLTKKQVAIARKLDIELVATNDVHYVHLDDAVAQDALLCVQTRRLISDKKRMTMMDSPDFYLRSSEEMIELFKDYPDAIENTVKIADKCDITIPTGQLIFPEFAIPKGETLDSVLRKMAFAGAEKKLGKITPEIEDRINYELKIISDKGYSAYFLITQDFVNWAKAHDITVGPGRGSAAGSLVSFSIGITTIDPLLHGLAFERFLNPQRPTPPDIDLDFADTKRDQVIKYVSEKYGDDHVGHVITFGKMEARVAIRDIGRVLGYPYEDPDKIAKLIPNDPGKKTSLKKAIAEVPELAEYYKQPKFKKLIDLAMKVEGSIRHSSVHAAAIIITDKPLPDYVAIQKDSKSGKTITQFDMYALDCNVDDNAIGLLKFDFLGLRNLTIINTALRLIKENKQVSIDMETLPLDDKKTFELLSSGDTFGVFQLESAGMRRVARTLKPNLFSDITAMVALYRPGPMDLIPTFIEGKHDPKSIQYPDDTLIPVLQETYGVMVYQEQILQIANVMAGYSLGEADILRRAIGKKKKKLLDENKKRFIDQSVEKGYKKAIASKVWGFIEAFANYGFNKAHAASYAMIAYQTAYLKANFPVEYMTALMSVESGSTSINRDSKIAQAIETSKKMGIKIYPPDINHSEDDFIIEQDKDSLQGLAIRFGFTAIKHIGIKAIENILETRKQEKEFTSLTQFIHTTDSRKVNKTTIETLIKVGVMDKFGNRASMLENLESIRQTAGQLQSDVEGQDSLFGNDSATVETLKDSFPELPEYPRQELLSFEKELLGLYLTDHPMAHQLKAVSKSADKEIGDLDATIHKEKIFKFGGILSNVRTILTKQKQQPMAFAKLEDDTGAIDVVIFPKAYEDAQELIHDDSVVLVRAKVDERDEELQLLVEKVSAPSATQLNHEGSDLHKEIFVPRKTTQETLQQLGKLLKAQPGSQSVLILIPNGAKPQKMLLPYGVNWTKELEGKIAELLK
ncbi:DNA polymerase III subunit alpha [Candidatus Woesebacteria bacterium]|nr:DNA polymerase III subunit alpha [Candidatus Woesebacteria bacterium]